MKWDYKRIIEKIKNNKYYKRFAFMAILFILGTVMLSLKDKGTSNTPVESQSVCTKTEEIIKDNLPIEERLKTILCQIEGVGALEVMVTMENSGEVVLDKDNPTQKMWKKDSEDGSLREERTEKLDTNTVIISDSEGEKPIIIQEIYPDVRGVLVIAEGASNITIKNNILNATKVLLDIPVHKIEVLEMKKKEKGYE